MFTILIGIIFFVVLYAAIGNGEWGVAVLFGVILLVLIGMAAGDRANSRAWLNFRNYWASGGPDRPIRYRQTRNRRR